MKFEELQGKRVVFSGECVPLAIRTKAWQARKLEIAKSLRPEIDKIDVRLYPRVVSTIKKAK